MLLEHATAVRGLDLLIAKDFFREAHRMILAGMGRLVTQATVVDFVTLKNELDRTGELDEVGGPAYLTALVDGLPRGTNLPHYIDIVRELRRRRDLVFVGTRIADQAYAGVDTSAVLLGHSDEWLAEIAGGAVAVELVGMDVALPGFLDVLEHRVKHKHALLGLSTGLPSLDDLTCGLVPGEMTILAAMTGAGKTALGLNIAETAARAGVGVVYASLEMSRQELQYRIASTVSRVELIKVRKGWLNDVELEAVCLAMTETARWPLYIDETSVVTVRELRARCRRLAADRPIGLIVVDYIQLLTSESTRRDGTRAEDVAQMSRGLKLLGRELKVPILVLSQFSRAPEKLKRRPQLSDLRDSGALEQDADVVWLLWQDPDKVAVPAELIIAKQRQGPVGTVELMFDKGILSFRDVAWEATKEAQARAQPTQERFAATA